MPRAVPFPHPCPWLCFAHQDRIILLFTTENVKSMITVSLVLSHKPRALHGSFALCPALATLSTRNTGPVPCTDKRSARPDGRPVTPLPLARRCAPQTAPRQCTTGLSLIRRRGHGSPATPITAPPPASAAAPPGGALHPKSLSRSRFPSPSWQCPALHMIRVVTECSGLEPLPYALDQLGLHGKYVIEAACEVDRKCRRVIRACHDGDARPRRLLRDITVRLPAELPDHDLYVAGFPCQPFSCAGKNLGLQDGQGRGLIIKHVIAALQAKMPRAFVLENVKGLTTHHRETLQAILHSLRAMGDGAYRVGYKVLDTMDFGLPQHRERTYVVGCLRRACAGHSPFKWPAPVMLRPLSSILRGLPESPSQQQECLRRERRFLRNSTPRLRQRLRKAYKKMRSRGINPYGTALPVVVDVGSSRAHWMVGKAPCLTHSRTHGFYLPALGRMTSIAERLRLQGLPPEIHRKCSGHVTNQQLGSMIGNAMTVNTIAALLSRLLPACGLTPEVANAIRTNSFLA